MVEKKGTPVQEEFAMSPLPATIMKSKCKKSVIIAKTSERNISKQEKQQEIEINKSNNMVRST